MIASMRDWVGLESEVVVVLAVGVAVEGGAGLRQLLEDWWAEMWRGVVVVVGLDEVGGGVDCVARAWRASVSGARYPFRGELTLLLWLRKWPAEGGWQVVIGR